MFLLLLGLILADDPPAKRDSFADLLSRYEAAEAQWDRTFEAPEMADATKPGSIFRYAEWPAWTYAPKFLAIAEADPEGSDALDALLWITKIGTQVGDGDSALLPNPLAGDGPFGAASPRRPEAQGQRPRPWASRAHGRLGAVVPQTFGRGERPRGPSLGPRSRWAGCSRPKPR